MELFVADDYAYYSLDDSPERTSSHVQQTSKDNIDIQ